MNKMTHKEVFISLDHTENTVLARFVPLPIDSEAEQKIAYDFNHLYYHQARQTWGNTYYRGMEIWQSVADLWVYQEIIWERKPIVIVETGTGNGACTLYFANILDNIGRGRVLSIDTNPSPDAPQHDRIFYMGGESIHPETVYNLASETKGQETMVFLDSRHTPSYLRQELELYSAFIQPGGYIVAEDTNLPGMYDAVSDFLETHGDFYRDEACEKFYLTFHPGGWLRRNG